MDSSASVAMQLLQVRQERDEALVEGSRLASQLTEAAAEAERASLMHAEECKKQVKARLGPMTARALTTPLETCCTRSSDGITPSGYRWRRWPRG